MARPKKEKVEKEETEQKYDVKQEPYIDALGNYITSDSDNRGILEDETHIIGKEQNVLKAIEYATPKFPNDLKSAIKPSDFNDNKNYEMVYPSKEEDFIPIILERRFEKTSNLYEFLFLDKNGYMEDYIQTISPVVKDVIKTFESSYPATGFKEIKYKVNLID